MSQMCNRIHSGVCVVKISNLCHDIELVIPDNILIIQSLFITDSANATLHVRF